MPIVAAHMVTGVYISISMGVYWTLGCIIGLIRFWKDLSVCAVGLAEMACKGSNNSAYVCHRRLG